MFMKYCVRKIFFNSFSDVSDLNSTCYIRSSSEEYSTILELVEFCLEQVDFTENFKRIRIDLWIGTIRNVYKRSVQIVPVLNGYYDAVGQFDSKIGNQLPRITMQYQSVIPGSTKSKRFVQLKRVLPRMVSLISVSFFVMHSFWWVVFLLRWIDGSEENSLGKMRSTWWWYVLMDEFRR